MGAFTAASLLGLPLALAQDALLTSAKRGLVYVETSNPADDRYWNASDSDLTWYYNYGASPTESLKNSRLRFVPMLWGAGAEYEGFNSTVQGLMGEGIGIEYALGFNEPDGCKDGGSCVDAQTAAETWKAQMEPLKEMGVKLGAPAVIGSPAGLQWLQEFFSECAGGCSVDFMPVHWYGDFEGLVDHVEQVNATYQNISSLWLTEYNYPHQPLTTTQAFYNASAAFLARVPYIQHYSLFGAFRSDVSNIGPNAAMLNSKGRLTDIGAWYLGLSKSSKIGNAADSAKFAIWGIGLVAASVWWLA